MQKIDPFLWFNDQAEEAVHFYTSIFPDSRVLEMTHLGDDVPGPPGKVIMATFELAGQEFMALNGGPVFSFTPAVSFFVSCQTEPEVDALWEQLSAGGSVMMPLQAYPFSKKFGWAMDRYGVTWQLNLTGQKMQIAPFFLFVGKQNGKTEEAIHFYTSLFPDAGIRHIERFGPGEGQPEGAVKHASFFLNGQDFMAMDGGLGHDFTFTPAISFMVNCENQAEVDYLWEKLSANGEEGQCGWLTDPYGVSWQIVPTILGELMSDPDAEKAGRVTQAMLKMTKLDIGLLKQAYEQV